MPTTPEFDLPYPSAAADADVPYDMQQLAEAVEEQIIAGGATAFDSTGISYQNSFTAFTSAGWSAPAYCRVGGFKYITGAIARGTSWTKGTVIMILPVGWRPARKVRGSNCEIDTSGNVTVTEDGSTAASFSCWFA